jgi:hypothetical protein
VGHAPGPVLVRDGSPTDVDRMSWAASEDLAVDDDNPRARQIYLREGYEVVRPHVDEYQQRRPDGRTVDVRAPGVVLRKDV